MMPRILIDSWFWVALNYERDQDHDLAVLANDELLDQDYVYVTTNFILAEAYTLLRRWAGPERAIAFGHEIREAIEAEAMELMYVTPEMEADAWTIFERYSDVRDLSYVDCTTFAAMQELHLSEAVTNDEHFSMMGFVIKP
jgi:predicted nucleic acid-binding protein